MTAGVGRKFLGSTGVVIDAARGFVLSRTRAMRTRGFVPTPVQLLRIMASGANSQARKRSCGSMWSRDYRQPKLLDAMAAAINPSTGCCIAPGFAEGITAQVNAVCVESQRTKFYTES